MGIPTDYRYTREHEWASYDERDSVVTIGITDYATEKLGEIVYVELPEDGAVVEGIRFVNPFAAGFVAEEWGL